MVEAVPAPTLVYDDGLDVHLGSRQVLVRSFPGHTGGDSVVLVPDARVAFGGDLLWHRAMPNLIDASIKPWIATLTSLAKNLAGYSFVPGHGEVGTAQDVTVFQDYLALLLKLVADARAQGRSGDTVTEIVAPALAPRNILDVEAELSGTKKVPQPAR